MRQTFSSIYIVLFFAVLTGCTSTSNDSFAEQLAPEEARSELLQISKGKRAHPPRTINDIINVVGTPGTIPSDCKDRQRRARENLDDLVATLHEWPKSAGYSMQFEANAEFTRGRIKRALQIQGWAAAALGSRSRLDPLSHAGAYAAMAMLYGASGDADKAGGYAKRVNAALGERYIKRLQRTARYRSYIAIGQASVALAEGEVEAAEVALRVALHYGVEFQYGLTTISRAWMQGQLISVLLQQGKLLEAEVEARKAILELSAHAAYQSDVAIVVAQLAAVLAEQDRNEEAILTARWAIDLFKSECVLPESIPYMQSRRILIQVLVANGDWQSAYQEISDARLELEIERGSFERLFLSTPEVGLALVKGGEEFSGLNALADALDASREQFGSRSAEYKEVLALLAVAQMFAGYDDKAREIFNKIIPDLLTGAQSGVRFGAAARNNRQRLILESALDLYASALDDVPSTGEASEIEDTLFRISQTARLTRVQRAFSAAAARSAATDGELESLVRNEQDARDQLASTLETLSFLTLAPRDQVDAEVVAELNNRASTLKRIIESLSAKINREFPRYSQLLHPAPLSIAEAGRLLERDEAILRIHVAENFTYVWAIANTGKHAFIRVPRNRSGIEQWIRRLRSAVAPETIRTIGDVPPYDVDTARTVYDALLRPLENIWINSAHILVVADSPLSTIPLSILVRDRGRRDLSPGSTPFSEYRTVDWLVNSHAFSSLPAISSLRSLQLLEERKLAERLFIGFGDPDFSSNEDRSIGNETGANENFNNNRRSHRLAVRARITTRNEDSAELALLPPLPETARELRTVARILGADEINDVFLQKRASETRVKTADLSEYRIVAFATHGLLPGDLNGLYRPALALSAPVESSELDDGLLTTDEIVGLKLFADWAVLSACNTGAGDGLGAEAISGLGRAFIYAGASALLVSNWPVHSESTVDLMIHLFKHRNAATVSRSESLRQAQVTMLATGGQTGPNNEMIFSYAHPLFWAPFSIVGNGR